MKKLLSSFRKKIGYKSVQEFIPLNKRHSSFFLASVFVIAVSCAQQRGPNEYTVIANEELVVPKKFTLKKPSAVAQGVKEKGLQTKARIALTGKAVTPSSEQSNLEKAILKRVNADEADANIRKELQDNFRNQVKSKKRLLNQLLNRPAAVEGKTLDPEKERNRLIQIIEQECKKNKNVCIE